MNRVSTIFSGLLAGSALLVATAACPAQDAKPAPKKILLVSVAKSWGHASIPTGIKVVTQLAKTSGAFTVDEVKTDADMKAKMTPEALKQYDGAFFLSTTGDIPLPDLPAFLAWIKSGKAFIGAHSATDTLHGTAFIDMIGGEFESHVETTVTGLNMDPAHPAMRDLGKSWLFADEIYFHRNFSRDKVHMLLSLDLDPRTGRPAFIPLAWCKKYGEGNVFFTALGHEDAMWENPKFQQHLLGGIKWALGLEKGDATPQTAPVK